MSDFNASVMAALDQFNDTFAAANAATGGPKRPSSGTWVCLLSGIDVDAGPDTKIKIGTDEVPGFSVQFHYTLMGSPYPVPPEMKQGESFPGRTMFLPVKGVAAVPASNTGKRKNVEITTERLKGILKLALGDAFSNNIGADLQSLSKLLASKSPIVLKVRCKVDTDEKDPSKSYFEEWGVGREA